MDKRTLKPSEVNPNFLKGIEQRYGKINPEYDFFSQNLDTYFKYEGTDSNTGSVEHKIIKLASFADSLKEFYQALLAIESLLDTDMGKVDPQIRDIAFETRKIFNNFRTHIRNKYPEQYNTIKDAIKEVSMTGGGTAGASFSPGTGEQYATPFAFNKDKNAKGAKNIYYYKLGFKPVPKITPKGYDVKHLWKK
jgi:hypothetical protein